MLELKNINYSFENKNIIENFSYKFLPNKIYVITGHNGSGKSTLAKIVMGQIQATSGKIVYDDNDISSLSVCQRANLGFSLAYQQPVKFKGLTVKKLFEIATTKQATITNICEYLSKVGLCARDYLDRVFDNTLSGGERKRIEIALTLARNANVNIFDEPEAGIDLWSYDQLLNIFKEQKNGKINIIISHQEKILDIADEIIVMGETSLKTKEDIKSYLNNKCEKIKGESN